MRKFNSTYKTVGKRNMELGFYLLYLNGLSNKSQNTIDFIDQAPLSITNTHLNRLDKSTPTLIV